MKLTKERLCTIATLSYHLLFLGGSSALIGGYVEEIDKLRQEIVKQADRAEKVVRDVESTGKDLEIVGNKVVYVLEDTRKQLKKAEKACKKIRF